MIYARMMKHGLRMRMSNVYAKGGYCVQLKLGSKRTPLNLIIDTGSSTFALLPTSFDPTTDTALKATTNAQELNYGEGGWVGPVIRTRCEWGKRALVTDATTVSLAYGPEISYLEKADGILGLAYHHLNRAYDLSTWLKNNDVASGQTVPWPKKLLPPSDLQNVQKVVRAQRETDLTPYFSVLEEQGLIANRFALSTRRSGIHYRQTNLSIASLEQDPLNQGVLVLGGGEEHGDLYQGPFQSAAVKHDIYYNLRLLRMQVRDYGALDVDPLDPQHLSGYVSNAIIDSGSSALMLTEPMFAFFVKALNAIDPKFGLLAQSLSQYSKQIRGVSLGDLRLVEWPSLVFVFEGANGKEVKLSIKPDNYWQSNNPQPGLASLRLLNQLPGWPNQTIFGLPLMNPYYVVFDRSLGSTGVVRFAPSKSYPTP